MLLIVSTRSSLAKLFVRLRRRLLSLIPTRMKGHMRLLPHDTIFWLNGMAGTGKSTISRTVAASFNPLGILGACFFFKKGAGDQGNARRLFSTIAWQLAFKDPRLAPYIMNAINKEPDVSEKSPREQFNCILLQPLRELEQ